MQGILGIFGKRRKERYKSNQNLTKNNARGGKILPESQSNIQIRQIFVEH